MKHPLKFPSTIVLALLLMGVICMMILPLPAWMLDVGLAASFALAILMFTVTLFIERPLEFSAFPTILLASLMLRLSLNVASTKLIIGQGHTGTNAAGDVIEGFAMFIMQGSVVIGLIVFTVLLIVNFMVINKGATRMAEVGARFALDAMPGKQLAIDSDVAAGAIDHAQARDRRALEQAETTFFGSLDGTSKFVKGDAIAGLLITGLNLIVGFLIGVIAHDMPANQAFETYSILTVGDGLVSQIPAVLISIASALLLARGGTSGATDIALTEQLGRYPGALGTVAALLLVFAFVPGLPFLPFLSGATILLMTAAYARHKASESKKLEEKPRLPPTDETPSETMGDILEVEDIHLEFARDLVPMALDPMNGLDARIANMRTYLAKDFGVMLPEVRLTDSDALATGTYVIRILGVQQATDALKPDHLLALLPEDATEGSFGDRVAEPVYGAPAVWITPEHEEEASLQGMTIIQPAEVLATHLLEVVKSNFPRLLTMSALQNRIREMTQVAHTARNDANKRLLDELIPDRVPIDLLLSICRSLLEERVSIRNLPLVLEAIAEARMTYQSTDDIYEHVRQRLGFQIIAQLKSPDGTIPLIQIANEWEDVFRSHEIRNDAGSSRDVALPPDAFNKLITNTASEIEKAAISATNAAIVTNLKRRRFIRTILSAKGIGVPVLSYEEIGIEARPALIGVIAA